MRRRSAWRTQQVTDIVGRWTRRPVDGHVWIGKTWGITQYRRRWASTTSAKQKTTADVFRSLSGMDLRVLPSTMLEWFDWNDAMSRTAVIFTTPICVTLNHAYSNQINSSVFRIQIIVFFCVHIGLSCLLYGGELSLKSLTFGSSFVWK